MGAARRPEFLICRAVLSGRALGEIWVHSRLWPSTDWIRPTGLSRMISKVQLMGLESHLPNRMLLDLPWMGLCPDKPMLSWKYCKSEMHLLLGCRVFVVYSSPECSSCGLVRKCTWQSSCSRWQPSAGRRGLMEEDYSLRGVNQLPMFVVSKMKIWKTFVERKRILFGTHKYILYIRNNWLQ